jgi:hypothetical protein
LAVSSPSWADAKKPPKGKVFNEMEFLRAFTGKSRQQVSDMLGKPERREQSVKPAGAEGMVRSVGTPKPVNVEMWYYKNMVEYAKKKTYKSTELTFVNDRCANIAFFNTQ